ncbi:MAG: 3'-5' exonuclease [Proteobacteria bacterium]|nr:3'-5' exonuclease [Pseudomonadota bacterium]
MKYLSFDIEATGLNEQCLMIEFAMVPFDAESREIKEELARSYYIKCPSFEELKPTLDPWVVEHNETLIRKAHSEGIEMSEFKRTLQNYLESPEVKSYFGNQKITLFGKSMSAIDLPFLNRDLGWDFMRKYFQHRQLDLSGLAYGLMDCGLLPKGMESGSQMMRYLSMGEVAHTALEDARNTAKMYLKIIEKIKAS